jgi:hypothetical protein
MTTSLRVRFDGKVLVPQEPVDLPTGQDLDIQVTPVQAQQPVPAEPLSSLAWLARNAVDDPSLPTDLSANLHHYLYGVPKESK